MSTPLCSIVVAFIVSVANIQRIGEQSKNEGRTDAEPAFWWVGHRERASWACMGLFSGSTSSSRYVLMCGSQRFSVCSTL